MLNTGLFESLEEFAKLGRIETKLLDKLGLKKVIDALFFFPRSYEDYSVLRRISELEDGETTSVIGKVADVEVNNYRGGRSAFYLLLEQDDQLLRAVWFNQSYRAKGIAEGSWIMLSGKANLKGPRFEMTHPNLTHLDPEAIPDKGSIVPVYRLTEGLKQNSLRKMIHNIVDEKVGELEEIFPDFLLARKQLIGIKEAISKVHQPESNMDIEIARHRLVFQELLTLQLAIQMRKLQVKSQAAAPKIENSSVIDSRIKRYFPYQLTESQLRAIDEISTDLNRSIPMNRLLHGDVGCGKTSVALYSLLLTVAGGYQAIMMAPTEALALQHFRNLQTSLANTHVKLVLLTGSQSKAEKSETLRQIKGGEAHIVIGTQALLQTSVSFKNPGLVIVDEQHRFGVKQRAILRNQGVTPHYLVMTATPIPRSMAMTLFGDLDVSVIKDKPPNRPPVHSYLCDENKKNSWWEFVQKKVREGRQAYVIAPLVKSAEQDNWESVEQTYESLSNGVFSDFRIDLVHGGQQAIEKEFALRKFAEGETQILTATSVVEVGIDVPNATLMTVLSASRFGLSQLHQLRGRVSRGAHAGYFTMFSDTENSDAQDRLQSLVQISDGFQLAEVDFQMRGPGDLFGTKQHGLPPLFVADLQKDESLLTEAKEEAEALLSEDPDLTSDAFRELKSRVLTRYGNSLNLSDVG